MLHKACEAGHLRTAEAIADYYLEKGISLELCIDYDFPYHYNVDLGSAYELAVVNHHTEVAEMLLMKMDPTGVRLQTAKAKDKLN